MSSSYAGTMRMIIDDREKRLDETFKTIQDRYLELLKECDAIQDEKYRNLVYEYIRKWIDTYYFQLENLLEVIKRDIRDGSRYKIGNYNITNERFLLTKRLNTNVKKWGELLKKLDENLKTVSGHVQNKLFKELENEEIYSLIQNSPLEKEMEEVLDFLSSE